MDLPSALPLAEDFLRRIESGRAHDAAAWMRRRAAHIQIVNGSAVLRPARYGPQKEQLLERQFTLKDIAFRQAELALDIQRRQHLAMQNDVLQIGRVLRQRVDY